MKFHTLIAFFTCSLFVTSLTAGELSTYRLGPGDEIRINVTGEDDLLLDESIGESGFISYPFLGDVDVNGMTSSELDDFITRGLKGGYLINPDVTVSVKKYRKFFVTGKVKRPGGFAYEPGMTVRKAISLAGGFDERANQKRIFVTRSGDTKNEPEAISLDDVVNPGETITIERSFF